MTSVSNDRWEQDPDTPARFVSVATLPTLQEMTTYRVALAIWYNFTSSSRHSERFESESKRRRDRLCDTLRIGPSAAYWDACEQMVVSLKLPGCVEKTLMKAVESIVEETESWAEHFQDDLFSRGLAEYRIEHLNLEHCVWLANGKIDYGSTGRRMLFDDELSLVQKFAIMCEFCMEDELKKIARRDLPESFVEKVNFGQDFLLFYWICYLKNDFGAIPLDDYDSVDMIMGIKCDDSKWPAFEYFWNRLGDDDQVSLAVSKIENNEFQERILSKMSLRQQRRVFSKIPDKILINFCNWLESPEHAFWTWKNYKNSITPSQFANVVNCIFDRNSPFETACRLLLEIWHSASSEQRNFVAQTMRDEILISFFCKSSHSKAAFEFLYAYLSQQSEQSRRDVLLEYASQFGVHVEDPNSMNDIVRLCLPDADDLAKYKTSIMESHDLLFRSSVPFNDVRFDNLLAKIRAYSLDAKMAEDFVTRLVDSKYIRKNQYVTKVENWAKFSQFVDQVFSQHTTSGTNLKKHFIMSFAQACRNDWNDDTLNETIEILKSVMSDERELQTTKKYFFESFQKVFFDYDFWPWFNEEYFIKFVSWCLNDDRDAVAEFVKNIPIDAIFDWYMGELEGWYEESSGFDESILPGLDNCLRWYFKGVEAAKGYKVKRANAYEQIRLFEMILQRNDESSLDVILKWIFDQDEEAVQKFKTETIKFQRK